MGFELFPKRSDSPQFFFSQKEKEEIEQAILALEKKTSAELRVHVERRKKNIDLMVQAREAFERLGMTQTNHRNGVLIFICSDSREFVILGDTLIDKEVPQDFWSETARETVELFRQGEIVEGVTQAIFKIGEQLKDYFPYHPDDKNELPDGISFN